ncbi:hypothetical protein CR513_04218, partial [Mucuna pruriens]
MMMFKLDKIRSDVLQTISFPTIEQVYAHVRREDIHQTVILRGLTNKISAFMVAKGVGSL